MDSKYYIPKLSEFHVGFELERNTTATGDEWHTSTIDTTCELASIGNYDRFRVKYLNREDIESLGFEFVVGSENPESGLKFSHFKKDGYEIHLYTKEGECPKVAIEFVVADRLCQLAFRGKVKNVSELKRILKQVGYDG